MRHSRSAEFARAHAGYTPAGPWSGIASDPNDARVLAARAEVLRRAWRPAIADRTAFLVDRCRGRRVLDIGCVAHDTARMQSPLWLHGRLADVATSCLGVDVAAEGVAEMQRQGFEAVVHDLRNGTGPLEASAPFDVIVAGELIEHLGSVDSLFEVAAAVLADDGQLIVTTPNPYASHRVRAGQRGIVWENVDHILYAFPSGIAELADRHGLALTEAASTAPAVSWAPGEVVRRLRRWVSGRQWATVGFTTIGPNRIARIEGPAWSAPYRRYVARRRFTGETFVYVLRSIGGASP